MAARKRPAKAAAPADLILDTSEDATLLDMLDRLLDKGVVLGGDVVLGVAGVDLVYLRMSALLSAIDRVMPRTGGAKRRQNRGPRRVRRPR